MEKPKQQISNEHLKYLKKTMSSNALFLIIYNHLLTKEPASFIRFADGDFEILNSIKYNFSLKEKYGQEWIKDLGMENINIYKLAEDILEAGNNAKYIAPSISGVNYSIFDGWHFFKERDFYFDIFSFYNFDENMIDDLYKKSNGVGVITRNAKNISEKIYNKYKVNTDCFILNNYNDINKILDDIKNSKSDLFIISGGPIGKNLAYKVEKLGKIIIDLGRSIEKWC